MSNNYDFLTFPGDGSVHVSAPHETMSRASVAEYSHVDSLTPSTANGAVLEGSLAR